MYSGLIAIDLDGTLLQEGFYISESDLEAIKEAHRKRYLIAICTGRSVHTLRGSLEKLKLKGLVDIVIGCNGVEFFDVNKDEEVEMLAHVTKEAIQETLRLTAGEKFGFAWYTKEAIYTTKDNPRLERIQTQMNLPVVFVDDDKIGDVFPASAAKAVYVLFSENDKHLKDMIEKGKQLEYDLIFSDPIILEVIPVGVSKASAYKEICRRYDINQANTMAIGDYDNDLAMIQLSSFGVAMGGAVALLKEKADYVTATLQDNGVAEAILLFLITQETIKK